MDKFKKNAKILSIIASALIIIFTAIVVPLKIHTKKHLHPRTSDYLFYEKYLTASDKLYETTGSSLTAHEMRISFTVYNLQEEYDSNLTYILNAHIKRYYSGSLINEFDKELTCSSYTQSSSNKNTYFITYVGETTFSPIYSEKYTYQANLISDIYAKKDNGKSYKLTEDTESTNAQILAKSEQFVSSQKKAEKIDTALTPIMIIAYTCLLLLGTYNWIVILDMKVKASMTKRIMTTQIITKNEILNENIDILKKSADLSAEISKSAIEEIAETISKGLKKP